MLKVPIFLMIGIALLLHSSTSFAFPFENELLLRNVLEYVDKKVLSPQQLTLVCYSKSIDGEDCIKDNNFQGSKHGGLYVENAKLVFHSGNKKANILIRYSRIYRVDTKIVLEFLLSDKQPFFRSSFNSFPLLRIAAGKPIVQIVVETNPSFASFSFNPKLEKILYLSSHTQPMISYSYKDLLFGNRQKKKVLQPRNVWISQLRGIQRVNNNNSLNFQFTSPNLCLSNGSKKYCDIGYLHDLKIEIANPPISSSTPHSITFKCEGIEVHIDGKFDYFSRNYSANIKLVRSTPNGSFRKCKNMAGELIGMFVNFPNKLFDFISPDIKSKKNEMEILVDIVGGVRKKPRTIFD